MVVGSDWAPDTIDDGERLRSLALQHVPNTVCAARSLMILESCYESDNKTSLLKNALPYKIRALKEAASFLDEMIATVESSDDDATATHLLDHLISLHTMRLMEHER